MVNLRKTCMGCASSYAYLSSSSEQEFRGSIPAIEVRVVANLATADIRSTTGNNLFNLRKATSLDLNKENMSKARTVLLNMRKEVPVLDSWRIGCLRKFLNEKFILVAGHQPTDQVDSLIDSLCTT